jgi:ribose transport system permease protein
MALAGRAVVAVIIASAPPRWMHGLLITRLRLQPFIVTLCGLLIYRGLARYIAADSSKGSEAARDFNG